MEEIEKDFIRFLRHEAMFRNTNQNKVLEVIITVIKSYEVR